MKQDKNTSDINEDNEICLKMQFLFENYRKPDGSAYTFAEVGKGAGLNYTAVWKYYNGQVKKPNFKDLRAIADFFAVDYSFWINPLDEASKQKIAANTLTPLAREVARKTDALPFEAQQVVRQLVDSLDALQNSTSDKSTNNKKKNK